MTLSDNGRGILFMCASMLGFTVNDGLMKAATQDLPLFQAILMRGVVTSLGLMLLALVTTGHLRLLPPRGDRRLVGLRTLGEISSTLLFLLALVHMPLANLSAIMQSLPLVVTLAAAVFLGEPIGWRRLSAIVAGLVGVLIIIRPGGAAFDHWALIGLGSVACVVLRDLATRRFSREMPTVVPAIWAAVSVAAMGGVGMIGQGYQTPSLAQTGLTSAAALFLVLGYMMAIKTMRVGDLGLVAPFRYTSLLWAVLLGWAIFGTWPDQWTWVGSAIVVASGVYMLWRERQRRLAATAPGLRA